MLGQRRRRWVNVVFAGNVDKSFAPKWNNKFRLSHVQFFVHKKLDLSSLEGFPSLGVSFDWPLKTHHYIICFVTTF